MTNANTPNWRSEERSIPLSEVVVDAVADEMGTDRAELPALYETIDPDALDRLFAGRDPGHVVFSYCGREITLEENGELVIHRD